MVNIIDTEGRLQQVKESTKAEDVLSQNPNCFMCSSESMYVGRVVPHVGPKEELQIGHIYFLLPLSQSQIPLSLQDLGALAIKANAALAHHSSHTNDAASSSSFSIFESSSSIIKHKSFINNSSLSSVTLGFSR